MADDEEFVQETEKPRKRKATGLERDRLKRQHLQSHTVGPNCNIVDD
jgi:hypothetical protein